MHENREISGASRSNEDRDRSAKALSHKAGMHVPEKSDRAEVPMNQPNKGEQSSAEAGEGRARIKENIGQSNTSPTQSGERVSQGLSGVRQAARERKQERFTALLHHLTVDLLRDSFYALRRQAAPGVDGVTWREYETGLEARVIDLHNRVHRGTYQARPSRRVYIPKADGRQRPLGVAALEDKIVQQAVVTILNEIYEVDFKGFSYGFRSHEWAIKFVEHRVADPRILRLIQKWLKAGVSEDGQWSESKVGTPQGAVVSPLLANVYLHYVFDLWIEAWRKKVAVGEVIVVRYADDLVVGFESRTEAERFLGEFRERLAKFGLELHAEKTRLIEFGKYAERVRKQRGKGKPETFTFLGFTHYCGKRRSNGSFIVWRKTASKRMVAKLRGLKADLTRRMHEPTARVGEWLKRSVQGYYQYHAVPGNLKQLSAFRHRLCRLWRRILNRRSQRGEKPWQRLTPLLERWIPFPRVLHPYPQARFAARHPR
jgi:RNA-directed DNA polymerase